MALVIAISAQSANRGAIRSLKRCGTVASSCEHVTSSFS